jgi:hypothetical protein
VGGGDDVGVEAIERSQKPSGEPLLDVMEAVAGGVLCHLHGADGEALSEDAVQFGQLWQQALEGGGVDTEGVAGDLYHDVVSKLSKTGEYRQTDQVFAAGDANLDAESVLSFDDEGGNSGIYEIDCVNRFALAQQERAKTERSEFQIRFEDVEFFLGDSEEDGVADRSSRLMTSVRPPHFSRAYS